MQVCRFWYTIVTGIWASLKLGTRTPKQAITSKLERNQWLLDVVVDTEVDRSDFTQLEDAYKAVFAAIEASPRWRTFVVDTLPAQTDLLEHLVNRGLQRCSNTVMNRLRTFRINRVCEMSPLLDRILRILGTSASGELMTVEINLANVISFLAPTYPSMFQSIKVLCLDTPGCTIQWTFYLTSINLKHLLRLVSPFPSIMMMSTYHLFIHSVISASELFPFSG